jgi:hypothetical protein
MMLSVAVVGRTPFGAFPSIVMRSQHAAPLYLDADWNASQLGALHAVPLLPCAILKSGRYKNLGATI